MSLLMAAHADDGAMVLTDTLATTNEGAPHLLVSKAPVIPHLELVIAGTGVAQVAARWRSDVFDGILCLDIDMLAIHAPRRLREIDAGLQQEFGALGTSTVYHYGWSNVDERYVAYAFRSTDGYAAEPLEPGFRVKPQPISTIGVSPATLDDWVNLARTIREEQDRLPHGERVYIGGELVLTVLQARAVVTQKVFEFDDLGAQWLAMNAALDGG